MCSGRARIVADDISANIKHKMTKEQKKVHTSFPSPPLPFPRWQFYMSNRYRMYTSFSLHAVIMQAAILEAREGRHEGWKDKHNKKGGGTTNLEKLKSKP